MPAMVRAAGHLQEPEADGPRETSISIDGQHDHQGAGVAADAARDAVNENFNEVK